MTSTTGRQPRRPMPARLARLHLRTGATSLARAELETLAGRDALDDEALLDLAEARWRSGDLAGAGDAARAFLESGEETTVALAIAAEAAEALGRPVEARRLAGRAAAAGADALDAAFAGLPRSAIWPGTPAAGVQPSLFEPLTVEPGGDEAPLERPAPSGSPAEQPPVVPEPMDPSASPVGGTVGSGPSAPGSGGSVAEPSVGPGAPGFWEPGGADLAELMPAAREALSAGAASLAAGRPEVAAIQLSVALRLQPELAAVIIDLVAPIADPRIELVRGDALRIAGREPEARRAWGAALATTAIDAAPPGEPAGKGGQDESPEETT